MVTPAQMAIALTSIALIVLLQQAGQRIERSDRRPAGRGSVAFTALGLYLLWESNQ